MVADKRPPPGPPLLNRDIETARKRAGGDMDKPEGGVTHERLLSALEVSAARAEERTAGLRADMVRIENAVAKNNSLIIDLASNANRMERELSVRIDGMERRQDDHDETHRVREAHEAGVAKAEAALKAQAAEKRDGFSGLAGEVMAGLSRAKNVRDAAWWIAALALLFFGADNARDFIAGQPVPSRLFQEQR